MNMIHEAIENGDDPIDLLNILADEVFEGNLMRASVAYEHCVNLTLKSEDNE